jgi:N utilization substance protein B
VALQLLFQADFNPDVDHESIEQFVRGRIREAKDQAFCLALYRGVRHHQTEIDEKLAAVAENWRLPRMNAVDRNVLRLGAFELLFDRSNPVAVVINEAIELSRRFGSKDSPAFVNGLLDRVAQDHVATTDPAPESN